MKNQIIKTTIFKNNLKKQNTKIVPLKTKLDITGATKYLPSFSKEWKDIIYSFNKNNLKNLGNNRKNIDKIIKSYFNLFFKDYKYLTVSKFILLKKRRRILRKIFVSNAEIKYTSNKAKITLYTVNREKKALRNKFLKLFTLLTENLYERYTDIHKNSYKQLHNLSHTQKDTNNFFISCVVNDLINKKQYINYKLTYLHTFVKLNNLLLKKVWSVMIQEQSKNFFVYLRNLNLLYSLNQFKFNKLILLPKLSNVLHKVLGKKLEYNIINLKSIAYNTNIFTEVLALKIKKIKAGPLGVMLSGLNKVHLPEINSIQERSKIDNYDNLDVFKNKYKDLKVLSNINKSGTTNLLNKVFIVNDHKNKITSRKVKGTTNNIHNSIYNSIHYKNMAGVRLEVKGRLTKRYRADRSVFSLKLKGGLRNVDSSFKGLSSVLFRGNTQSNISYSLSTQKRRVGAFAVKGWIGGK
jgi:hypothetical protein